MLLVLFVYFSVVDLSIKDCFSFYCNSSGFMLSHFAVSDAAVCEEAEELEMRKEKYMEDLQQALMGTESSVSYSFTLTPSPPTHSCTVTLTYEKVQKDISVSVPSFIQLPQHPVSVEQPYESSPS